MNKELVQFLLDAKKSTYAGAKGDGKTIVTDGSMEFNYSDDTYTYRDRYFGSDPFVGEEVVFLNDKAIWVMNYRGYIIDKTINERKVYGFLKKSLMEVLEGAPFRGPSQFTSGDYKYTSEFKGDPDSFVGSESISHKNTKVYELFFHGGVIS